MYILLATCTILSLFCGCLFNPLPSYAYLNRAILTRNAKNNSLSDNEFYTYIALNKFARQILQFILSNDIMIDYNTFIDTISDFLVCGNAVKEAIFERWRISILGDPKNKTGNERTIINNKSGNNKGKNCLKRYFDEVRNTRLKNIIAPFLSGGSSETGPQTKN